MTRPTLVSLAELLGVSRTTVSNAFSRPDQLSPELRERILRAATDAGYAGPNLAAASLRTGRTNTLGILFTDSLGYAFRDPVSTAFLAGVASEAETAGYAMTIVSAPRGSVVSPVSQAAVDGLILYSVDDDSPALRVARTRQVPQVMVDQVPTPGVACVNVADRIGAGLAISHLFSLGHRRIGAVTVAAAPGECSIISRTATSTNYVARERYAGWCESAEKLGMRSLVAVSCPVNEREHGRHAAALLCQQPEPPTAIACLSDELALGLLAGLRAAGLRVPQEVSVIGFDDTPLAAMSRLPLSTIRQPYQEKGAVATRLLLDRIGPSGSNSTHRTPTHVLLPVQLITRASTGKAPPSG